MCRGLWRALVAKMDAEANAALAEDDWESLSERPRSGSAEREEIVRAAAMLGASSCLRGLKPTRGETLARDRTTWTSLHHAARGGHEEAVKELILPMSASDLDFPTKDVRLSRLSHSCGGVVPLHLAASSGEVSVVRILLEAKADPNLVDNNGWSAADHAKGRADICGLLAEFGGPTLATEDSLAAYAQAVRERNEAALAELTPASFGEMVQEAGDGQPEALEDLLRRVDVKSIWFGSSSALQAAVALGSVQGVEIILQALEMQGKPGHSEDGPAKPLPGLNQLDLMGFGPIHTAIESGFPECLAPLLKARANPELRTADASFRMGQTSTLYLEGGRTPLHLAADKGSVDAVSQLLTYGASKDLLDSFNMTASDLVLERLVLARARNPDSLGKWLQLAQALGLESTEEALSATSLTSDEVEKDRRQRQVSLRTRITAVRQCQECQRKMEVRRDVMERYRPLDKDIAVGRFGSAAAGRSLVAWEMPGGTTHPAEWPLRRQLEVTGDDHTGAKEPFPGVFVFSMISEQLCSVIWAETQNYTRVAAEKQLPLPTRHDGSLDISQVFPELLDQLAELAMPAIQRFLPSNLHKIKLRHAFRTFNHVDRKETFERHCDKYAVTLNICIHKTPDVAGSGVFFYTSETSPAPSYRHEHHVGLAVLHSSKEWHETEPLTAGERGSIIFWFDLAE